MRRRLTHRSFTFVVGVALLAGAAPTADARSGRVRPSGEFAALSYNVAGLPEALSGSDPEANAPLISPLLDDYDLVLLQENWADPLHDQRRAGLVGDDVAPIMFHHLVVGAAHHPYRSAPAPHPYGVEARRNIVSPDGRWISTGPTLLSDGLNRLSTMPFGEVRREMWRTCFGDLTMTGAEEALAATGVGDLLRAIGLGQVDDEIDGGAADCMAQKGFSFARTAVAPGVEVDVYNLHADASSDPRDAAARADNFAQLADFIAANSAGRAVILGGDTNLKTGDPRPERQRDAEVWSRFLASTGLIDVCGVLDCGVDAHEIDKFAFRSAPGLHIEPRSHAFERAKFSRDGAGADPLSDHDPLAVVFRWKTKPGR